LIFCFIIRVVLIIIFFGSYVNLYPLHFIVIFFSFLKEERKDENNIPWISAKVFVLILCFSTINILRLFINYFLNGYRLIFRFENWLSTHLPNVAKIIGLYFSILLSGVKLA